MAYEIGRLCVKIAGRDAGKKCVILQIVDKSYAMIDGETRRRKCNMLHLEPLEETLDIKENASESDVKAAFKKLGIEIKESKKKEIKARPRKVRKVKKKATEEGKAKKGKKKAKKAEKKEEIKPTKIEKA